MSVKPYYAKDGVTIYHGDCRDVLPTLEPATACVTDPPYGLGFMGKGWDHEVPGVEFWRLVRDALLPGAACLTFGGPRTYHRLMCAIEDAGFEIRDCLMWLYGTGFPKSLDISKAIDKAAGAERERIRGVRSGVVGVAYAQDAWTREFHDSRLSSEPITDPAREWYGWGTALKPAWEPILLAMNPLDGTFAENAIRHGVVIDPFMGSGTTLIAARSLGLKAVGIEIKREYCQIAVERLHKEPAHVARHRQPAG